METELKYSTSPRILFETAVLKAGMPQADYDIESLIGRIAALEKQLANGVVVQNAGGRVALNENVPVEKPASREVPKVEKPAVKLAPKEEEIYDTFGFDIPPDEEQTGGNAYFDGFEPRREKPVVKATPAPVPTPAPQPAAKPVKTVAKGDGKATFGTFLRTMRKIARNGVLLTLCMDLDGEYDGDVFVLYTTSDTIYRSLTKVEHYNLISQAFAELGFADGQFEIRLRGKQSDNFQKTVNEIQSTFEGVKIDIK
jgi:hypothetical protein